MKRILLSAFLILGICFYATAQEGITKEELFRLYNKATKAERNGNTEEALNIYKTLLALEPSFPTPYLKMANIYAADEGNGKSAAMAIELYNRYLELQPAAEDAATIKRKVAQLQIRVGDEQHASLKDIVYINQEEAVEIVYTKGKQKPSTKAELEQQVEETNEMYSSAQEAIKNNDISSAEKIMEEADPTDPRYIQTTVMLAGKYGEQGDMNKMNEVLTAVEEDMAMNEQAQQYHKTIVNDDIPFGDDICGIWVSDLSYKDAIPFLAIEIRKADTYGKYKATILPYCTLAEQHSMYNGKPFNYIAKYNTINQNYFAYSSADSVQVNADVAYFFFGDKKCMGTSKEFDDAFIKPLNDAIGQASNTLTQSFYNAPSSTFGEATGNIAAGVGIQVVSAFMNRLLALSTVKTNKQTGLDFNIQRLFTGCASLNLVYNTYVITTDGYEGQSSNSTQMRLYKLYSEDTILFAANGNELFGYREFSKDEVKKMEEYKYVKTLKNRDDFNKQSYKKLSERVVDYCFAKATETPDFKNLANDCRTRFEYSLKGLSYREFENKDGSFKGWVDISGKMNGVGKCTLRNGITYVGNWENNQYSGEGRMTLKYPTTNEVLEEYTGTFENSKYNGKGLLYSYGMVYDGEFTDGLFEGNGKMIDTSGDEYCGTWKRNKLANVTINYANGDRYEGQCAHNKKTQKIERNGKGTITYANGEEALGKWKGNEFITKK